MVPVFGGGSFSRNTPSLFAMLTCLHFRSRFIDHLKSTRAFWGSFWVLWCFVFQHLAKHECFRSVFFLRNGVPFLWCCSGALCADFSRFSFLGLLVACAVVLCWLWARRVWSGRLGPGIILVVFLGRLFGAPIGHMDSAEMHKNKLVWGYLCAKSGSQNRCMRASLFLKQLFSRMFIEFWRAPFGSK